MLIALKVIEELSAMLGLFSGKADHPLADPREIRAFLDELAGRESASALDEVAASLESLVAADDLRLDTRLELVGQLADAAAAHARRLARDYLTSPRLGRAQEFRLWLGNRNYWAQLSLAYERCLAQYEERAKGADAVKPALAQLYARLLNAYGALVKWDQFRYGPVDTQVWASAGQAYLGADRAGLAKKRIALYSGGMETSPEEEYLKALVFSASSTDCLLPLEIELAERFIGHFVGYFVFTAEARPENVYWVDSILPRPPTRLALLPEITPTLRFFNAGQALDAVQELHTRIKQKGEVPPALNLGGQYSPRIVLPVLEHLAAYWAPKPPMRHHPRHSVKSRLTVIHGLASLHRRLNHWALEEDLGEAWIADDVSLGGMGARVTLGAQDWIRIGTLVGTQPEGGDNWLVAVIRRFVRESASQGVVGIETLSKTPQAIVGDSNGLRTEAVLLDPVNATGETVRMVLPSVAWEDRIPLLAPVGDRVVRFQPVAILETGVDFVLGRYEVAAIG